MACNNHSCSCMERLVRWLEESEVAHSERALKLSKIKGRQRDVKEHESLAKAFKHALTALHGINCDRLDKPVSIVVKMPWYQRWYQKFLQLGY